MAMGLDIEMTSCLVEKKGYKSEVHGGNMEHHLYSPYSIFEFG
jgi:hypothetical protein